MFRRLFTCVADTPLTWIRQIIWRLIPCPIRWQRISWMRLGSIKVSSKKACYFQRFSWRDSGHALDIEDWIHVLCDFKIMVHRNQWLLNNLSFVVSLEDAHRYNDLSLFDKFKRTIIILGVVTIATSRVETVDEIKERVTSVLHHIPAERLILAPDCGLGYLPKGILKQKLQNLVEAAKSIWKSSPTHSVMMCLLLNIVSRIFHCIVPKIHVW